MMAETTTNHPAAPEIGSKEPGIRCRQCDRLGQMAVWDIERKPNGSLKIYVECSSCGVMDMYRIGL